MELFAQIVNGWNLKTRYSLLIKQPLDVFCKKGVLRNPQENTCARVSFLIKLQAWGLDTFFTEHLWTTASAYTSLYWYSLFFIDIINTFQLYRLSFVVPVAMVSFLSKERCFAAILIRKKNFFISRSNDQSKLD